MAEEEQNEETPETEATPPETDPEVSEDAEPAAPSGDTPEAQSDAPAVEEAPADEAPADEAPAEDAPAEDAPAEDAPAEDAPAEDAPAEDAPAEEAAADEPAAEEAPAAEAPAAEKPAKDRPPGADLEPIAIEDERELTAEERARKEAEAEERAAAEQAATAETSEEPARRKAAEVPADARIQATGKRKSAIARVVLTAGSGEIKVNDRELDVYFPRAHDQTVARQALVTAGYESSVDVRVRVHGGGVSGQAGAVRHGIARALTEIEPELRRDLKRRGLLTRDAREKERRKAGLKKARKRPQFSKR
jgi:small subunit ribosomal protein S9